ncbi:hypothetical protein [Paenibacillus sp. Y412MC10]|uniref:hypothetical protein n=1 Tax=Geobacillus sp. (strain Y412MC10) TaxID=481743 RepID=UPI0011AAD755|nr:hypothetical protein [Paenibacillus sp. Y412MC10]
MKRVLIVISISLLIIVSNTESVYGDRDESKNDLELAHQALISLLQSEIRTGLVQYTGQKFVKFESEEITDIKYIPLESTSEYLQEGHAFEISVRIRLVEPDSNIMIKLRNDQVPLGKFVITNIWKE